MHIVRDERHIEIRGSIGKYAAIAGLGALISGLIISFIAPENLGITLGSMILGYILTVIGGFFSDRYAGPLAHHQALADTLKGLDSQHILIDYILPANHVLLEPSGLTIFIVRTHGGEVTYDPESGRWRHRQRGKFFRQLAGQGALGMPDVEAETQKEKLEAWLAENHPHLEVPVRAVILFVNPDVQLEADDVPVPTFYTKKVKGWLRGPGNLRSLPKETHRQLATALGVDEYL